MWREAFFSLRMERDIDHHDPDQENDSDEGNDREFGPGRRQGNDRAARPRIFAVAPPAANFAVSNDVSAWPGSSESDPRTWGRGKGKSLESEEPCQKARDRNAGQASARGNEPFLSLRNRGEIEVRRVTRQNSTRKDPTTARGAPGAMAKRGATFEN